MIPRWTRERRTGRETVMRRFALLCGGFRKMVMMMMMMLMMMWLAAGR